MDCYSGLHTNTMLYEFVYMPRGYSDVSSFSFYCFIYMMITVGITADSLAAAAAAAI